MPRRHANGRKSFDHLSHAGVDSTGTRTVDPTRWGRSHDGIAEVRRARDRSWPSWSRPPGWSRDRHRRPSPSPPPSRSREPPERARLPGRLAAGVRRDPSRLRCRRRRLAGDLRRAGRLLGVQGGAERHVGRELRPRRRARRPEHPARPRRRPRREVLLRRRDPLGHGRPQLGDRGVARQLPERARVRADWDPGCLRSWLQDPDGDGVGGSPPSRSRPATTSRRSRSTKRGTRTTAPAASRTAPNIAFSVGTSATSSRSPTTRRATSSTSPSRRQEPVDDAALVRAPVRHPFEDEVLYFAIPDRFDDGDPSNNCGDYAGAVRRGRHARERPHARLPPERQGLLPRRRPRGPPAASCRTSRASASARSGSARSSRTRPCSRTPPTSTGMSSGYHGYWILDYLHVDPHLGTNAEFAALVDEAHARG